MKVIQTALSYSISDGENNNQPSLTVPDMAMSVQEILQRFATGRPIPDFSNNLHYGGEDYYPDMKKLDLVEQQEIIEINNRRIQELEDKIRRSAAAAAKVKQLEAFPPKPVERPNDATQSAGNQQVTEVKPQ